MLSIMTVTLFRYLMVRRLITMGPGIKLMTPAILNLFKLNTEPFATLDPM